MHQFKLSANHHNNRHYVSITHKKIYAYRKIEKSSAAATNKTHGFLSQYTYISILSLLFFFSIVKVETEKEIVFLFIFSLYISHCFFRNLEGIWNKINQKQNETTIQQQKACKYFPISSPFTNFNVSLINWLEKRK